MTRADRVHCYSPNVAGLFHSLKTNSPSGLRERGLEIIAMKRSVRKGGSAPTLEDWMLDTAGPCIDLDFLDRIQTHKKEALHCEVPTT
jgi:hypothetical protein